MESKVSSYKDMIVFKRNIDLLSEIYLITSKFPSEEKFGINQIRNVLIT